MGYPAQHGFPTHKECANFQNGTCMLIGVAVDPNGPVCPNFTPKMTPQMARTHSAGRQPGLQPQAPSAAPPQQPAYPQQPGYLPSHTPYSWQAYGYPFHSAYLLGFMQLGAPYGWGMTPWYVAPFPYPEYGYQAPGYGYQPYYTFPFPPFQLFFDEELRMLEAYREELQAEIEAVDARVRELRGGLGAWRRL